MTKRTFQTCSFLFPIFFSSCLMAGGCSYAGKFEDPKTALGLPDYKTPPGVTVKKNWFGASATVTSDSGAKVKKLTYDPQTGGVEVDDLDLSTNVTPLVTQLGANSVGIKDQYAAYKEGVVQLKTIEAQEFATGVQGATDIAKALAPFLGPSVSPAAKQGLLAGLTGGGITPKNLFALASELNGALTPQPPK